VTLELEHLRAHTSRSVRARFEVTDGDEIMIHAGDVDRWGDDDHFEGTCASVEFNRLLARLPDGSVQSGQACHVRRV
jgi:hypothetical protein